MIISREVCHICGCLSDFEIEDGAVLFREAKCKNCGASIRNSDVADELIKYSGSKRSNLLQNEEIKKLHILNTCSSGYIHDALKSYVNYTCCEYFDNVLSGDYVDGVLCVDLTNAPFEDDIFDVVITEDVFEHVDGYEKAFEEIHRILKPGGVHIFTVPIHEGKKTSGRKGKNPVYHGDPLRADDGVIVFTDWGNDIKEIVEKFGFDIRLERKHIFYNKSEITDVDQEYEEYLRCVDKLDHFLKYNSIVLIAAKKATAIRTSEKEIIFNEDNFRHLFDENRKYRKEIIELNKNIRYKKDIIKDLNDDNERRGKHNLELDRHINNLNIRIHDLQDTEKRQNQHIAALDEAIENYTQLIQSQEQQLRSYEQQLQSKSSEIADLQQTIRNKEGHIELLLETERAYEREKNTHSYKLAKRIQKAGDFLLPPNSRRRFFCRILYNMIRHPRLMFHVLNFKRVKNYIKYMKLEGMEGVKKRYEEAVAIEKMQHISKGSIEVEVNEIAKQPKRIEEYEKIVLQSHVNPVVSIIIPAYNEFDHTYNCIRAIVTNSGDMAYEIIVADDHSTDLTCDIEKLIENIRVIRTEKNLRFLLNCNNAAQYARGEYILFLNNDTQVQENWLRPLIELMERDDKIGMVGSKLVYPDGYLQEAGGIVWKDGSAWNYGNRKSPEDPEYNYVKEADYISGAAIMIRAALWNEIGGFDERFIPAYYEDTDLAFEVRKHGFKVVYQPLSVVVHFEGVSNGTDLQSGLKQYQEQNYHTFYEKWKDTLETFHEANGENVFTAKDRSNHKKHILVVDHYVPHYDQDAGGRCTYMYLKLFVKMGFQVTFLGDNFYKHEPYTTELNQLGIEVLHGNYYYHNWQEWLKENLCYFDYVYLQRPHISVKYIDLVKCYSKAKVFYFAHDLHHVREYREYEMTGDPEKLQSSQKWKEIEYELFEKADVGHVVGSYEQAVMQNAFPDKVIRNIPLYVYESLPADINKDFEKRSDLLYVGGFGHPPNVDAVLWFIGEVYPKVLEKYPDMVLHIVGGKVPKDITELASPNVVIEGFVSDNDLERLYRTCRLAVVPLRFGAGVKGKVVEAGYYQIPLITTSIGAEGIDISAGSMIVEDDAVKMAETINHLYEDFDRLRSMSDKGLAFIKGQFTVEKAEKVLREDIEI